ncbi:probable protein phosphatase 2C 21 isoform X2 [Oryza brachyantha]|nr:probable protein phosphatase 2C 21 isoform X2 [Oryza brachyantha]
MYCARRFHIMLREDKDYFNKLPNAIISVYSRLDDDLQRSNEWRESLYPRGNGDCFQFLSANLWPSAELPETTNYVAPLRKGSTACVVIIRGNHIIVGNLGDSRCVLSENGQAFNLSIDHKPNIQPERLRIERAGGRVLSERVPFVGPGKKIRYRCGVARIEGRFGLSRAIGDFQFKQNKDMPPSQQIVTCVPDVHLVNITDKTEFLVIASDGVWSQMSSKEVVDFVRKELNSMTNLRAICEKLLDRCLLSKDNVTAILVQFKPRAAVAPNLSGIEEPGIKKEIDDDSEELPLSHHPQE